MSNELINTKLHKDMLEFLKKFNTFCIKNEIKYSLHGGTLLGAIREKGFIPWDDDIDVSFTRNEFEKFKIAIKQSEAFNHDSNFFRLYEQTNDNSFVWIDIFVYDYISSRKIIQKFKIFLLAFLMAWRRNSDDMKITKAYGLYKGWKYAVINIIHLLGVPFSENFKDKFAQKAYLSFPGAKKFIHRTNDDYIGLKIILPVSVMSKYEMKKFEDTELMVTSNYKSVLKSSYGDDYMVPKKDRRIESHNMFRKIKEKNL